MVHLLCIFCTRRLIFVLLQKKKNIEVVAAHYRIKYFRSALLSRTMLRTYLYLTTTPRRVLFDYSCQFACNEKMQMSVALSFLLMSNEKTKS